MFYNRNNRIFILKDVIFNDEKQCFEIRLNILTQTFAPKKTTTPPYTIKNEEAFIYTPIKHELDIMQTIFYYTMRFKQIIEEMCNENKQVMRMVSYGRSPQYAEENVCYSDDERKSFTFYRRKNPTYNVFNTKAQVYLEIMKYTGMIDQIVIISSYENDNTVQKYTYDEFYTELKEKW